MFNKNSTKMTDKKKNLTGETSDRIQSQSFSHMLSRETAEQRLKVSRLVSTSRDK